MSITTKNGKFYYQFMAYGIRKHGLCRGCEDETAAKLFEANIRKLADDEHLGKIDKTENITCKYLFDTFLIYSKANKKDYNKDISKVEILKQYFPEDLKIIKITPLYMENFKLKIMSDRKISGSTFNRYYALISKAFNFIIVSEQLKIQNPCKFVKKCKEDNNIIRYLTPDEEKRLLKELDSHLVPIVICALTTGLRLSNILNLKWEAINIEYGFIEILKQENKGHKKIQIPLSNKFKKELEKIGTKKSGYIFVNPNTNKPYTTIKNGFNKALERANIKNFRFHDLRHTVGTRLVANGADLNTVKELLAHSSITTTQKYMHPTPENMLKAVDILDKF